MLLLEDRRFYIYVYMDPRKPGKYKYGEYVFDHCPFYIGKGHSKRLYRHIKSYNLRYNMPKHSKIKKLIKLGYRPIILKYLKNLTEQEAFDYEIDMIKIIGRRDKKLGPLSNLTDGGEGISGFVMSEEAKIKLSESRKGVKNIWYGKHLSEEHKKNISRGNKGKHYRSHSKETKKKIGEAQKGEKNYWYGKHLPIEIRKKISESRKGQKSYWKGKHHSEESKNKMSRVHRGFKHSEESKRKMSRSRKGDRNHFYGKHHTEETKMKLSEASRGKRLSEETKRKMSEAHKGKYVSDETKKKISKGNKGKHGHLKGHYHSEETKKKISDSKKGNKNPNFGKHFSKEWKDNLTEKLGHSIIVNDILYNSIRKAGRDLNLDGKTIRRRLKNKNFPNYQYVSANTE